MTEVLTTAQPAQNDITDSSQGMLHPFRNSNTKRQHLYGAAERASKQPRIRLQYNDESVRDRFCANTERLLQTVLEDPHANSTSARIAHKALRYRKVLHRLHEFDPHDPTFDVSTFFGVEWYKDPEDRDEEVVVD
ncbi:hypothetical protein PR003_g6459 [Phytophthora rubi]|uniref:Uncharacterized protein n=1 Tax=Phytophthora rubi TaxID=129364 RepID=A0A6A3MQ25_9STRA|nr:hypothetical protein PR002_g9603 [Phytophthora rubi]KAE9042573.1 hypothetical protein PR001_g6143 [Phytophthora rubi]KAE9348354.1 hypothetical protein PR003_g6459 [Phytophthora rubi]